MSQNLAHPPDQIVRSFHRQVIDAVMQREREGGIGQKEIEDVEPRHPRQREAGDGEHTGEHDSRARSDLTASDGSVALVGVLAVELDVAHIVHEISGSGHGAEGHERGR